MLNNTVKVTKEVSVIEFIEGHLEEYSEQAYLFKFTPDKNTWYSSVTSKYQTVNCSLYNVEPARCDDFRILVEKAYYTQQVALFQKKVEDKEAQITKSSKDTSKMEHDLSDLKEVLRWYENCLECYDGFGPDVECRFAELTASAWTGHYVKDVAIAPVLTALANEGNTARHNKDVINTVLHAVSMNQDDGIVKPYVINCNGKLYDDIKSAWYKGRKADKEGTVNRTFDTKGGSVRREIILAVIEYMQKKELFDREVMEVEEGIEK